MQVSPTIEWANSHKTEPLVLNVRYLSTCLTRSRILGYLLMICEHRSFVLFSGANACMLSVLRVANPNGATRIDTFYVLQTKATFGKQMRLWLFESRLQDDTRGM